MDYTEAYRFTTALHEVPERTFNPQMPIDWTKAPAFFPMCLGPELRLYEDTHDQNRISQVNKENIWGALGTLLWLSAGCHRIRYEPRLPTNAAQTLPGRYQPRRTTAAGGGAYPVDIMVVFGDGSSIVGPELQQYVFTYAPQAHSLVLNCKWSENDQMTRRLNLHSGSTIALALTVHLWRSAFKYHEFAYRLTAVDCGVVLGRLVGLLEDRHTIVMLDVEGPSFALDRSLGLQGEGSSCYVTLVLPHGLGNINIGAQKPHATQDDSGKNLRVRERRVSVVHAFQPLPKELAGIHQLAQATHTDPATTSETQLAAKRPHLRFLKEFHLPPPPELYQCLNHNVIASRASLANYFTGDPAQANMFAHCLHAAQKRLDNIQRRVGQYNTSSLLIFCVVINVDGFSQGVYQFLGAKENLALITTGDMVSRISAAMLVRTFDMRRCAFIVHICGHLDWRAQERRLRHYRVQQMIVGAGLDAVMTAAASYPGWSAHPFLGFASSQISELYGLSTSSYRPLAQLCVGRAQPAYQIETSVVT
jgi:hypothetical protein